MFLQTSVGIEVHDQSFVLVGAEDDLEEYTEQNADLSGMKEEGTVMIDPLTLTDYPQIDMRRGVSIILNVSVNSLQSQSTSLVLIVCG